MAPGRDPQPLETLGEGLAVGTAHAAVDLNEPALATAIDVSPSQAEVLWAAYAWPVSRQNSGNRAYFINHQGDVLSTNNAGTGQLYSGTGGSATTPAGTAAYVSGATSMIHSLAFNTTGADNGTWVLQN